LLRLITQESNVRFDLCAKPEFDDWCWVDYWEPLQDVVYFKRKVYQKAMSELGVILTTETSPVNPSGYLANAVEPIKSKRRKS
jgi:putative (di)nucleoside polyphosphate hydrolase